MAYYLIFAFFPLLMVIHASFSMAIYGFDIENTFFYSLLPDVTAELLDTYLEYVSENSNVSFLFVGIVLTVYTLTRFMKSFKRSARKLYNSCQPSGFGTEAGTSVIFSILIIAAFYISLFLLILGGQILEFIEENFRGINILKVKTLSRFIFTYAVIFSVVLLIYGKIPNVKHRVSEYLPGAVLASAGWVLLSGMFSFYMNNFSNYSVVYGSIGAFIMLMIWIYMSCLVLLAGSAVNAVIYHQNYNIGNLSFTGKEC